MNYSDILVFTIDSTKRLNEQLAKVLKSESALKISNESALYYSLATENFTENLKEYARKVWKFIKELVQKIKNFIVSIYKRIRDFIAKKVSAIKAKFIKKGAEANTNGAKPEEAKAEPAHEAAGDMRYYVGASNLSEFDKVNAEVKELCDINPSEFINDIKEMNTEEMNKYKEQTNDENVKNTLKDNIIACANALSVQKVPAEKYAEFASKYVEAYNKTIDYTFKIFGEAAKKFENFANSVSNSSELSSEQISFAKFVATRSASLIGKLVSMKSKCVSYDLSLVPATGFVSEEAAKEAFDSYKSKMASFFD